jgi:hypothetical protein
MRTYSKEYLDLVEEARAALGDDAPPVEQIVEMPHIKVFTDELKAFEGPNGARVFRCTASSTITDLHGDDMTEGCVRDMATQAKRGPTGKGLTIFLNHRYSVPEDVAGKVINSAVLTRDKNGDGLEIWDMDYEVRLATGSARIDQTWNLIKNDEIALGISIGAYILDYEYKDKEAGFWGGLIINKVLLVETSIVGIPANQRSWIQNAVISIGKSLGIEEKQIRRVLDGKEARPMGTIGIQNSTITTQNSTTGSVVPQSLMPAIEAAIRGEDAPDVQNDAPAATDTVADGSTDTTDTESVEAQADTQEVVAEAAPVEESPAEQTSDEDQTPDEETTVEASTALAVVAPDIANSLSEGSTPAVELVLAALEQAAAALTATRAEKAELVEQVSTLTTQLDQAKKDVIDAAEIVELIARTPLGRKTQFAAPVQNFQAKFSAIYDQRFLKLMDEQE